MPGEKKAKQSSQSNQKSPAVTGKPKVESGSSTSSRSHTEQPRSIFGSLRRRFGKQSGYEPVPDSDSDSDATATDQPDKDGGDVAQPDEESVRFLPKSEDSESEEQRPQEEKKAADGLSGNTSGSLTQQQKQSSSSTVGFLKKLFIPRPVSQSNKDGKPEAKKDSKIALPSTTPLSPEEELNKSASALVRALCMSHDRSIVLEYKRNTGGGILSHDYLVSNKPMTPENLEESAEYVEEILEKFNRGQPGRNYQLVVYTEDDCLRIEMPRDLLEAFLKEQKIFLSDMSLKKPYQQANGKKSIHTFLEERYLDKGSLDQGTTAIAQLLQNPEKINEINPSSGHSPLQHALFRWSVTKVTLEHKSVLTSQNSRNNSLKKVFRYLENVINVLLKHDSVDVSIFNPRQLSLLLAIAVRSSDDRVVMKLLAAKAVIDGAVLDSLFPLPESDFNKMFDCLDPFMSDEFWSKTVSLKIKDLLEDRTSVGQENIRNNCLMCITTLFVEEDSGRKGIAEKIASSVGYRLSLASQSKDDGGEKHKVTFTLLKKKKEKKDGREVVSASASSSQVTAPSSFSSRSKQVQAHTGSSSEDSEAGQVDDDAAHSFTTSSSSFSR